MSKLGRNKIMLKLKSYEEKLALAAAVRLRGYRSHNEYLRTLLLKDIQELDTLLKQRAADKPEENINEPESGDASGDNSEEQSGGVHTGEALAVSTNPDA